MQPVARCGKVRQGVASGKVWPGAARWGKGWEGAGRGEKVGLGEARCALVVGGVGMRRGVQDGDL